MPFLIVEPGNLASKQKSTRDVGEKAREKIPLNFRVELRRPAIGPGRHSPPHD
jgi:hypothetical protein